MGDLEGAVDAYDRSIENDSAFAPAWYNRACEHARLGKRHEALADLARAITLDPRLRNEATGDDYFRSLKADPAFLRLTAS
jgi:tetratricopeptide (TPR) repeat protein